MNIYCTVWNHLNLCIKAIKNSPVLINSTQVRTSGKRNIQIDLQASQLLGKHLVLVLLIFCALYLRNAPGGVSWHTCVCLSVCLGGRHISPGRAPANAAPSISPSSKVRRALHINGETLTLTNRSFIWIIRHSRRDQSGKG